MSSRIRIILLAVVVLAIGYPLAAGAMGFIVEAQLREREQAAVEQASPYFTIVDRSYHRKWFGATETVTFGLGSTFTRGLAAAPGGAAASLSSFRVTLYNTICYGPLPRLRTFALATVDTAVVLPPEIKKQLDALLGGKPPVTIHTTLGWLGGSRTDFASPAFKGEVAPHILLSSSGLLGTTTSTGNLSAFTAELSAKGFSLNGADFQAEVDDLRAKAVMRRAFKTVNVGDGEMTLARLDIRGKSDEPDKRIVLQQLELTSKSSATGDFLASQARLTAGSVQLSKFSATQAGYEFGMTHVYGPAFASLIDGIRQSSRGGSAGIDAGHQAQQKMMDTFRKDGVEVLLHDPVFEIPHFGFTTPEGQFSLSAKLTAPGLEREDFEGAAPAVMAVMLRHLQAQADIRVDTDLLDKLTEGTPGNGDRLAAQTRALEAQGFITHEGKTLATHFVFDRGKMSFNGKPFPPAT